ncbi:hypothetical protein FXB00_08805, partial [Campylobacter jejuni]|nr:hypothetical protein [Campylobacter jejuni]
MKKTIVAYRWDALGERMCAFLNAMYLADKFGYHFSFLWDPIFEENLSTHTFPNIPEKEYFFSKDFIKNHYFNENVKKIYNQWIESVWYSENTFEAIKNKTMFEWGIFCPYQGNLSDQFMDIDKLTYERKIKKYWNSIKFSNQIQETIDSANQTAVKLKNFIGIHIRTSDITRRYNGNHMYLCLLKGFPIYLAVDIIEKITTNIVLFGDDFEAIGDLKKQIYWRKNIFTVEELIDLSKLDVVQRTIFDVVLMSKSAQIYASGYSGFSNLAMRIGTCENMVSIYNYYSVEERYKILINNLKRYDFSIYQKSYAYIHLYEYSRNLNFCLNTQKKIILKGMKVRPDALIFSIFYINILFKECKFNKIEYFLSKKNLKLYLQNLLEP